jgi:hypothetical protein
MKFIVKRFSQPWQDKFDTFARVARPRLTFRRFTPRRTRATPFARATLALDSPSTRGLHPPLAFRAAECVCHGPYKDGPFHLGSVLILHHHPSYNSYCVIAVPPHTLPWSDRIVRDAHPLLMWTSGLPAVKPKATLLAHTASGI